MIFSSFITFFWLLGGRGTKLNLEVKIEKLDISKLLLPFRYTWYVAARFMHLEG